MSWWERQLQRYFVGTVSGISTALATSIESDSIVTVESLGLLIVTYEDEPVSADGSPVYVQNK